MVTFIIILIGYLFVSSIIVKYRNAREMEKAMAAIRQIQQPCPYPILMPVYGRPHYLNKVLNALAQVKDIDKTILIISQDGSNPEVAALIRQIHFTHTVIIQHTRPFLGILAYFWDSLVAASTNIHFLLEFTFSKTPARGAIVLEDDLVPSEDFFNYFRWAFEHILTGEKVLSVTGFNLDSRVVPETNYHPQNYPYDLVENKENDRAKFSGWSWSITGDQWRQVRKRWSFTSWDIGLDALQRKLGLISYKPVLGRVRNIGMQGGINFTEAEDNPKWRDIFIAGQSYDYPTAPRLHEKDDFVKLSYAEEKQRLYPNEKTRTLRNRLWLVAAVGILAVAEWYILFLR
jgi:hypothetical protein